MDIPSLCMLDDCPVPELRLLGAVILVALRDATQGKDLRRKHEALTFLWCCAPLVAERYALPKPVAAI